MADTLCPHCNAHAPLVMRGIESRCAACGQPRLPLSSTVVNVAGRPAQVGGTVARVLGWATLLGGTFVAVVLGALLQALFPLGVAGWIVGGAILTVTLLIGLTALLGGKRLHSSGLESERSARERGVLALAARKRGVLTPADVASALSMPVEAADALLTEMVRSPNARVALEVDDDGRILYIFSDLRPATRFRVGDSSPERGRSDGEAEVEAAAEAEAAATEAQRRAAARRP